MKLIPFSTGEFVPAGHENPLAPGVVKKVLAARADLQPGHVQMINWSVMDPGKQFSRHYHEDMQEIFVVIGGEADITVGSQTATLRRGDAVILDAREIHQMVNRGSEPVVYLAIGIAGEANGKTVLVDG